MNFRIKKDTLMLIMESARDTYPDEFAAFLRADRSIIYEIVLLPGTVSGRRSAVYQLYMKPIDFSLVGTVHSHPSGITLPSPEDLDLFSKTGSVHIIVGYPFRLKDFSAYDRNGKKIDIEIL
ncbi:MAG: Mov34/MPN/PAD-1 family protein [Thermoplasmata archaeon]|nr:Mov34/MPN/PAD-1 family protein [Thermoplasmata archaeon]